ncbi:M48 family metalloprotease [Blastopirellula sp. JC732]|uniref:M48 family metalloprotease n=1 Tax=Blastopirellula sediminis TaxID=2894196 RepID=A0A9X1SFV0_9BACT|nr:M48 family metalloprotease [Blastopirellula sediminis]MCC9609041.1 M48 family metalloprotease [Blastopirellula sediminis]MCC9628182.1 M48 family metalloprotease [Blastopirellula sediminis]
MSPMRSSGSWKTRLVIAAIIAFFAIASYYMSTDKNPVTGEAQRVAMTTDQEIALGLQAAPEMIAQHGGELPDRNAQALVDQIGGQLLQALNRDLAQQGRENPFPFEFHLLADPKTVNAFALPGGQVFVTAALFRDLETEGQLAGVLGHEMGHVLSRHGAQQMAKQNLTQGLVGAAGVAGGDANSARMAQLVGQFVNMKYGREDELESDQWGVRLMGMAGYDPNAMIGVMEVLERAGGEGPPEFLSTHPKPANRVIYIKQVIKEEYPNGVPAGLKP